MCKVTVLMAVYNGEMYLRETMDSVLGQTFRDFEFLIVDDGSTDRSRDIVRGYADDRIRLIENDTNLGLTRSLNRGLELARGELVARQDADDVSAPERLAMQVVFLEAHPDVVLAGSWYRNIDALGHVLNAQTLPCDELDLRWQILWSCPFVHSAVMLRRKEALERFGAYNEAFAYAQDYDWWSRIAFQARVANIDQYLLKYRMHDTSMTATYGERLNEGTQISLANIARVTDGAEQISETGFRAMFALVLPFQGTVPVGQLEWGIATVLRIQAAFCRYYNLEAQVCRRHRAEVCLGMSRSLVQMAEALQEGRYYWSARRLLVLAVRNNPRILRQKQVVSFAVRLLLGPRLTHVMLRVLYQADHE